MMTSAAPSAFQLPNFQLSQQQAQLQHQYMAGLAAGSSQHIHVLSNERSPLSYQAKWADIHDDSKNLLLAIEERILEYRDGSRRLDQCQRLHDSSAVLRGFELESARISQELGSVAVAVAREHSSLEEMVHVAKHLIWNAEVAVRTFIMLRHHFSRPPVPALTPASNSPSTTASLTLALTANASGIPLSAPATGPVTEFYSGMPSKPSHFLQETVVRFETQLSEYRQRIEELERLLLDNGASENGNSNSELSVLKSLPTVMKNVHDFFIHVAAEVESLHQKVEAMRAAFLVNRRRRGDDSNPFLEADRREVAKREVAAKRVHPTLHAALAPFTPANGLGSSTPSMNYFGTGSPAHSISFPAQTLAPSIFGAQPNTTPTPAASTHSLTISVPSSPFGSSAPLSNFSLFGASSAAAQSSPSIFGGPTPSASAPSTNLFGATPPTSTGFFGTPSGGLFGGTSGSLFGSPAPAAFGASTPTAPIFGMGSSGAGAAAVKGKPRGPRRK